MAQREPKTGTDFVELARKSDAVQRIREGKGSHVVVEFNDGSSVSIPVHGKHDLGKGIRHKLLKAFKLAGVTWLIILVIWFLLVISTVL